MSLKIDAWGRSLILVAIEQIEYHLFAGGSHAWDKIELGELRFWYQSANIDNWTMLRFS